MKAPAFASIILCMPEADGLFQKAIIQSGAKINITTKEISEKLGKAVVAEPGLTGETLEEIQTIEYDKLSAAGRKCQAEILGARVPGTVKMWGFVPTPDGKTLLQQPYTPGFAAQAKKIPVMIGTTFNELERTMYRDTTLDEVKAYEILQSRYGDKAETFQEAFFKAFPDASVADMLAIDSNMRTLSIASADAKSADNGATLILDNECVVKNNFDREVQGILYDFLK